MVCRENRWVDYSTHSLYTSRYCKLLTAPWPGALRHEIAPVSPSGDKKKRTATDLRKRESAILSCRDGSFSRPYVLFQKGVGLRKRDVSNLLRGRHLMTIADGPVSCWTFVRGGPKPLKLLEQGGTFIAYVHGKTLFTLWVEDFLFPPRVGRVSALWLRSFSSRQ